MNWCPTWICKIICFFIGHKWTDWWKVWKGKRVYADIPFHKSKMKYIRFCERCAKCEEANPELK